MAITRLGGANAITGTLPAANINDTSIGNITALPAGVGGKVLQVVTATDTGNRSTTSTSFVTGSNTLSVDITPASTSNKIFVQVSALHYAGTNGYSVHSTIYRDSTDLGGATYGFQSFYNPSNVVPGMNCAMSVLDSPSSTSALTYQVYFKAQSGTSAYLGYNNCKMTITAFEIEG
jgi:hypothetical protein